MHEVEKAVVVEESGLSRKKFLAGAAGIVVGGAFMGAAPRAAKAGTNVNENREILILNYALTLEHLEARYYELGVAGFRNSFRTPGQRAFFEAIRDHELAHVDALESTIESLGATPVPRASYNFGSTAYGSFKQFTNVASFLENTGVRAYAGAIAHLTGFPELLQASATIATVEARHAAYLNLLRPTSPFPAAVDATIVPRFLCNTLMADNGGFITQTAEPYGPYENLQAFCDLLPASTLPVR